MRRASLSSLAAIFIVAASSANAQQVAAESGLPVYIDVRASASDSLSMATFAEKLIEFALADVQGLQLRSDSLNPCTAFAVPQRSAPQGAQQSPPRVVLNAELNGSRFAVIRVILEEHRTDNAAGSPDWLVEYNVTDGEWLNGSPVCPDATALQQTQRVPQARLLDALNLAGRLVASTLSSRSAADHQNVRVTVNRGKNTTQDLVDDLSAYLASRIASTQEFRTFQRDTPSPSVDYILDVELNLSSNATDPKSEISGKLTIRNVKTAATTTTALPPQPASAPVGFFRQVADTSLQRLLQARVAADLSLNLPTLGGTPAARLSAQARALLCIDVADRPPQTTCKVHADSSLAVLAQLPPDVSPEGRSLLGRAQAAAGRYVDGARTFDQILESPATGAQRLDALVRAGDAYASAKDYDKAVARYQTWLAEAGPVTKGDAQALDVTLKEAEAQRISRAVDGAIDTLITAARQWPEGDRIDLELGRLVPDLTKVQLANLLTRLPSEHLVTARIRASRRLASEYVRDGTYTDAEQTLTAIVGADPSGQVNLDLASLYERWSQSPGIPVERQTELLRKSVAAVLPGVRNHNTDAYGQFVRLNHALGEDGSSRAEFEQMLHVGNADPEGLLQLMFVCNEYVFDFNCANTAADALDRIVPGHDSPSRQVNILEVRVVHGDIAVASVMRNSLVSDPSRMGRYRHIVLFYATWIDLTLGNRDAAANMATEWRREMDSIRAGRVTITWIFGGAKQMLMNRPGLSPQDAAFLLSMISAMENPTAPIPELRRG